MMAANEQTVNDAETLLSAASASIDMTITVANPAPFPTEGTFRLIVDSEIMLVTAVSGSTFTVTRGVDGTAGADHVLNSQVSAIVTRDGLDRFISERINSLTPERPAYRISDSNGDILTSSDFTVHNGSTLTLHDDPGGAIVLEQPTQASTTIAKILRAAPTPPYVVTGAFRITALADDIQDGGIYGPLFRDNSGNETINWRWRPFDGVRGQQWRANHNAGDVFQAGLGSFARFDIKIGAVQWFKIEDNNTNIKFHYSADGVHFITVFDESRTLTLPAAPDQIGISINNISTQTAFVQLLAWQE